MKNRQGSHRSHHPHTLIPPDTITQMTTAPILCNPSSPIDTRKAVEPSRNGGHSESSQRFFKKPRDFSKASVLGNQSGYITVKEREDTGKDGELGELGKLYGHP